MAGADEAGRDARAKTPSTTSLRALDALNVFLADVRAGMGPFLGTFLRESHHWDAGRVGIVLAASELGKVLAQVPAGAFIDRIRWKRLAVALALSLPAEIPYRAQVIDAVFAVVLFTIVVQGLAIGPVVRRLWTEPTAEA